VGQIDFAHSTFSKQGEHFIATKPSALLDEHNEAQKDYADF
jgi:hypothetical protein